MEFCVKTYWQAIAAKAGDTRTWDQLPLQHQQQVIASINILLQVLRDTTAR